MAKYQVILYNVPIDDCAPCMELEYLPTIFGFN